MFVLSQARNVRFPQTGHRGVYTKPQETARNPLPWGRMSLNRLLSFVPFVHRLGSAVHRRVSSGAFKLFLSFNVLTAVWGLMLLVSLAAFLAFAWFTPGVAYFDSTSARDAEIASINSMTGVDVLQRKAAFDVLKGYDNGATATFLCHIALGTLLFTIIGSTAGLLLVRWVKRHLGTVQDAPDTAPAPFER